MTHSDHAGIKDANPWNRDVPMSYSSMWIGSKECIRAIQRKTSDDENTHWLDYSIATHMGSALVGQPDGPKPKTAYRCLILGTGEGWMERRLRKVGFVGPIVASDVADKALARAREKSQALGYTDITYVVADLNHDTFEGPFDFIIAEGVLHHIERVEHCLSQIRHLLVDGGRVFACEYQGPTRFQLPELQVRWINAALAMLPRCLRPIPVDQFGQYPATPAENARWHYARPSEQAIINFDPSEAVCGPELRHGILRQFDVVEYRPFGGTLLSFLGGHFDFARANTDDFARRWLAMLIALEDTLIATGILESDFAFYVLGKPTTESPGV